MNNLELLKQAYNMLNKPLLSLEDIREIQNIIKNNIVLEYQYEQHMIDLQNECELNGLENQSFEQ